MNTATMQHKPVFAELVGAEINLGRSMTQEYLDLLEVAHVGDAAVGDNFSYVPVVYTDATLDILVVNNLTGEKWSGIRDRVNPARRYEIERVMKNGHTMPVITPRLDGTVEKIKVEFDGLDGKTVLDLTVIESAGRTYLTRYGE